MLFIYSLIRDSITLDIRTFFIKGWSLRKKIYFFFKKYSLLVKHFIKDFKLGRDYIYFDGNKIFYDSKYGLAGYQGIFCRQRDLLLNIGKIHKADCILDVGANVGYFSMLCRELYPSSDIYSFEPIPKTFECLKKNFSQDKKTQVFNFAVSDKEGKVRMSFDEDNSAVSKITDDADIEVKSITLDIFCRENNINHIDILKIDTETFENYVLAGASDILKNVRYILMEVTVKDNLNYTASSLFKLLSTDKYNFQILGFRNFNNKGEGPVEIFDVLLENVYS